ncbi:hypothetical protein KSU1_C0543 [Candidatus Jettenia caeni]|uniref:Intracellular proteinase inhibitor BsuPI domain-containing protein n=1 Tax=Candidatus Jettenia caeni TaxID=247490 RepID=I3IK94_9BACT|nr:BsuPI-related putative proteinase inhibitor [Candidatus Jettenia sp. AMX1]NUN23277.1 hypothetical protein [Candidatus Jettenia caeni]WKZ14000.1 MAG: BsuPI-related putative proteinase inhibitor [Candidatus Jettenia caeni]GAB62139.1 hypothetical protein KSU1_C0543 [Candidatus Jettenia caeni]GJQ47152.1 MAG: hypothetical protein JETCAE04_29060 [Candidatus Jettenia caeni]
MKEFGFERKGITIVVCGILLTPFLICPLWAQLLASKGNWQVEGNVGKESPEDIPDAKIGERDLTPPANFNLHAWLEVPPKVWVGEMVRFTYTIKNRGKTPIELLVLGDPACDFVVSTPTGIKIWRYLYGKDIKEIAELKILNPGEKLVYEAKWNQMDKDGRPVPVGKYWVTGVLQTSPPAGFYKNQKRLLIKNYLPSSDQQQ